MIQYLYEKVRNLKRKKVWYWPYVYKFNKLLVNIFFPITQLWKKENGLEANSHIIVSLTTFPKRIGVVWITVASLLNQSMKPYKVILWLAGEQFPQKRLPQSLRRMQKRGLEVKFCDDLKPHKKYYYAMQEYPDYYIITADDDIFYPENHIEQLWKGHKEYTNCVICNWSHKILVDENGEFMEYNNWINNVKESPSHLTLAVGCNGVLYPPHCLGNMLFDKQKIIERALFTDDLWLKCIEVLSNIKVININEVALIYFSVIKTQHDGLWIKNTKHEKMNDIVWKQLMEEFPEVEKCLQCCANSR